MFTYLLAFPVLASGDPSELLWLLSLHSDPIMQTLARNLIPAAFHPGEGGRGAPSGTIQLYCFAYQPVSVY